jgi:hypothetical protein
LEDFEPLYNALAQLSADRPRHPGLRSVPPNTGKSDVKEKIAMALAIEEAANSLIRYLLAEALEKIPKNALRWAAFRSAMADGAWDIDILLTVMGDARDLLEVEAKLGEAEIKNVSAILNKLDLLDTVSKTVRAALEARVQPEKSGPSIIDSDHSARSRHRKTSRR